MIIFPCYLAPLAARHYKRKSPLSLQRAIATWRSRVLFLLQLREGQGSGLCRQSRAVLKGSSALHLLCDARRPNAGGLPARSDGNVSLYTYCAILAYSTLREYYIITPILTNFQKPSEHRPPSVIAKSAPHPNPSPKGKGLSALVPSSPLALREKGRGRRA